MRLSPHFTLDELIRSERAAREGWDNTPNKDELANLKRLAQLLELVKSACAMRPVIITSGFRSKKVNDAVGSKDSSQHRKGCAADFRVAGMTTRQVMRACIAAKVPFDQIILEYPESPTGGWVHISVPNSPSAQPRNAKLVIDRQGTRPYA